MALFAGKLHQQITDLEVSLTAVENEHNTTLAQLQDDHSLAFLQLRDEGTRALARKELQIVDMQKTIDGLRLDLATREGSLDEARQVKARGDFLQMVLSKCSFRVGGQHEAHSRDPWIKYECHECGNSLLAPEGSL